MTNIEKEIQRISAELLNEIRKQAKELDPKSSGVYLIFDNAQVLIRESLTELATPLVEKNLDQVSVIQELQERIADRDKTLSKNQRLVEKIEQHERSDIERRAFIAEQDSVMEEQKQKIEQLEKARSYIEQYAKDCELAVIDISGQNDELESLNTTIEARITQYEQQKVVLLEDIMFERRKKEEVEARNKVLRNVMEVALQDLRNAVTTLHSKNIVSPGARDSINKMKQALNL